MKRIFDIVLLILLTGSLLAVNRLSPRRGLNDVDRAPKPGATIGPIATAINVGVDAARQAVARFMTALDTADKDTLLDAIYCDLTVTAQRQGLIAVGDCIVFQRALERAIAQRWGEDAARSMIIRTTFSPADHASIKTARVERRDNSDALVIPAPQLSPIVVRLSPDGRWRIVLQSVRTLYDSISIDHSNDRAPERIPEPGSKKQIAYLRGVVATLHRTAQAVLDNKFATPEIARAALQQALDAVTMEPPTYDKTQDAPEE